MYANIQKWEAALGSSGDYSYLLHDDAAMERLLYDVEWPEFPHLKLLLQHCTTSGAAKADLWRALVLWHYGGVYSDIDNAPGVDFRNGTIIADDMDSYFLIETIGIPSQYFFAASPKHPLMYLLLQHCLRRLLAVDNVGKQYTPWITGPGALKEAVLEFLNLPSNATEELYPMKKRRTYTGILGRGMTVDGGRRLTFKIVTRESIRGYDKKEAYKQMDMKHFSQKTKEENDMEDTCLVHILKQLEREQQQQQQQQQQVVE